MSNPPTIYGPDPVELAGRWGQRYWVHHPFAFTGNGEVDERLSGYPVAVFQPAGRPAARTPVVIGLQGMAAPYQWNGFLVPALLDAGIACVLFDTPLAGERSLVRAFDGNVLTELVALAGRRVPLTAALLPRLMEVVLRDYRTVLGLIEQRHGLTDGRRALFGISLGTLLSSYAFLREGVGTRLLGTIGHADLQRFARSYSYRPVLTPLLCSRPLRPLGRWLARAAGRRASSGLAFLHLLYDLMRDRAAGLNPMHFLDRAGGRRVRFLVGRDDPLVDPADAVACARRFPDGECYVVPGLGHGGSRFVEHACYFVRTQLGDWVG